MLQVDKCAMDALLVDEGARMLIRWDILNAAHRVALGPEA